jgi:hypothetical protein
MTNDESFAALLQNSSLDIRRRTRSAFIIHH